MAGEGIVVKYEDLVDGFKRVGLSSGDVVFVHSSLKSFGYVEGGAETVVKALLDVLGPEGTLSAPIFYKFFWEGPDQVWDRDNTPSLMGKISEVIRTWPGSKHSPHAPHPIAAIGKYADDLTERYNLSDFADDSPFARLVELNAWILLIGVDYNRCTLIHLLEEKFQVPYRHWVELEGTVIDKGKAERKKYPFYRRYEGVGNDFLPLGNELEKRGLVNTTTIGKSTIRAFRSKDLVSVGSEILNRDILFLVSEETRKEAEKYLK